MAYCRLIPNATILPWGCFIELDKLGLPATPQIYHKPSTCLCAGRQDELLLKALQHWMGHGAELMQIDPRCAAVTIIRLIDKWNLGTTDWLSGLQGSVQEWREDLVQKAIPNNPLANAKGGILRKRQRSPRLRPTGLPSAAELRRKIRWCEGEEY